MPKTLLLADDSVTIQKVVGISFANEDIVLLTVDNGDDALVRAREARPDIVLADVVMPGCSGYEVCEAIKNDPSLAGTPVLLLTGTFEAFDEERAQRAGADGHITKPFEAQALVDQVNALLAQAGTTSAPASVATEPAATGRPVSPSADTAYDFFDDEVTEPGHDGEPAEETSLLGAPSPAYVPRSDEAFGFEEPGGEIGELAASEPALAEPLAARPPEEVSAARLFDEPSASEPLPEIPVPGFAESPAPGFQGETRIMSNDSGIRPADSFGSHEPELPSGDAAVASFEDATPPEAATVIEALEPSHGPPEAHTVVTPLDADSFAADPIEPASDPFQAPEESSGSDPFRAPQDPPASDPFQAIEDPPASDPFQAIEDPSASDPFQAIEDPSASDPFAAPAADADAFDAFAPAPGDDTSDAPAARAEAAAPDPFAPASSPDAQADIGDPLGTPSGLSSLDEPAPLSAAPALESEDPLAASPALDTEDPLAASPALDTEDPFAASPALDTEDPFAASPALESEDPLATSMGAPPPRSDWDGAIDDSGDGTVAFEFGGPLADLEPTEVMGEAVLDPASGRDYDVSSSDLGSPLAPAPVADPEPVHELAPPSAPDVSPLIRQEVRDAIEKIAWEAFGQVTETLVKDALARIEQIAWEVVPQMTEALIREEIRKLKGGDPADE